MALYEEKVNGDPGFLDQVREEGRALGLSDATDLPADDATMLLRLSAKVHVLETENESLKVREYDQLGAPFLVSVLSVRAMTNNYVQLLRFDVGRMEECAVGRDEVRRLASYCRRCVENCSP
jgi:hypothetical protein